MSHSPLQTLVVAALAISLSFSAIAAVRAQSLLEDEFDYEEGALETVSSSAWTSNNGADAVIVVPGSLTYPGYSASTGGRVALDGSEAFELVSRTYAAQTSGTVYASFLLWVDSNLPGMTNDPFLAVGTYGTARIIVLGDGGDGSSGFRLCISKVSLNTSCTGSIPSQTTHLIVAAYAFGPGSGDDVASLWVNPATLPGAGSAPDADVTESTGADETALDRVVFENQPNLPLVYVDGLRVAASWSELPVELVEFVGRADGRDVILNWETASESRNAGFEVQTRRWEDWRIVEFIPGAGSSRGRRSYRYRVEDLQMGLHAFRLRQVDLGGASSYSPIVEVSIGQPSAFVLTEAYPNPFNPLSSFSLSVTVPQSVTVSVLDVQGRVVQTLFEGRMEANVAREFRIDGAPLASGTYIYRAKGESFEATRTVTLAK